MNIQDEPTYSLQISQYPHLPCVECVRPTGEGVVGHRNGKPLCDRCLVDQEPRLALPLAIQAGVVELADAARAVRPNQSSNEMLEFFGNRGRDVKSYFSQRWRDLWAGCSESRPSMVYDLSQAQRRAHTVGGPVAARLFEDPRWVTRHIRRAKKRKVNVKGYLFIAAVEAAGVVIDDDSHAGRLLDDNRSSSTLLFQPA